MIIYDTRKLGGYEILFHRTGSALFSVHSLPQATFAFVLTLILSKVPVLSTYVQGWHLQQASAYFTGVSFVVGFILVYRMQLSNERYRDAQTSYFGFASKLHDVAMQVDAFTSSCDAKTVEVRELLFRWIRLQHEVCLEELQGIDFRVDIPRTSLTAKEARLLSLERQRATRVSNWIYKLVVDKRDLFNVGDAILSRLFQLISESNAAFNETRRIAETPFPFAFAQIAFTVIHLWMILTPFAVATFFSQTILYGPITAFFSTWALFAVNEAAAQLENPFEDAENDFPLVYYSIAFNDNISAVEFMEMPPSLQKIHMEQYHGNEHGSCHLRHKYQRNSKTSALQTMEKRMSVIREVPITPRAKEKLASNKRFSRALSEGLHDILSPGSNGKNTSGHWSEEKPATIPEGDEEAAMKDAAVGGRGKTDETLPPQEPLDARGLLSSANDTSGGSDASLFRKNSNRHKSLTSLFDHANISSRLSRSASSRSKSLGHGPAANGEDTTATKKPKIARSASSWIRSPVHRAELMEANSNPRVVIPPTASAAATKPTTSPKGHGNVFDLFGIPKMPAAASPSENKADGAGVASEELVDVKIIRNTDDTATTSNHIVNPMLQRSSSTGSMSERRKSLHQQMETTERPLHWGANADDSDVLLMRRKLDNDAMEEGTDSQTNMARNYNTVAGVQAKHMVEQLHLERAFLRKRLALEAHADYMRKKVVGEKRRHTRKALNYDDGGYNSGSFDPGEETDAQPPDSKLKRKFSSRSFRKVQKFYNVSSNPMQSFNAKSKKKILKHMNSNPTVLRMRGEFLRLP